MSYSLVSLNLTTDDLKTGCGREISKILISSVSLETMIFSPLCWTSMLYEPGPTSAVGCFRGYFPLGYMLPKGTYARGILFSRGTSKLYEPGPTGIGLVVGCF